MLLHKISFIKSEYTRRTRRVLSWLQSDCTFVSSVQKTFFLFIDVVKDNDRWECVGGWYYDQNAIFAGQNYLI